MGHGGYPPLISPHNHSWWRGHGYCNDEPALFYSRWRCLHSDGGFKWAMGPEVDARTRRHRTARTRDRAASWRRGIRAGKADRGHVPSAEHHDAGRDHDEADPRWSAHPRDRSRFYFWRRCDGARFRAVVAPDGKSGRRGVVAAELGRAETG